MNIYTAVVNGSPVMTFGYDGGKSEAELAMESDFEGIRLALQEHVGPNDRPLLDDGDTVTVRASMDAERERHALSIKLGAEDYKQEGWDDFDPDDVVGFLVPVKPIDWDVDYDDDEAEAA